MLKNNNNYSINNNNNSHKFKTALWLGSRLYAMKLTRWSPCNVGFFMPVRKENRLVISCQILQITLAAFLKSTSA
jgi:hypothetical protein